MNPEQREKERQRPDKLFWENVQFECRLQSAIRLSDRRLKENEDLKRQVKLLKKSNAQRAYTNVNRDNRKLVEENLKLLSLVKKITRERDLLLEAQNRLNAE